MSASLDGQELQNMLTSMFIGESLHSKATHADMTSAVTLNENPTVAPSALTSPHKTSGIRCRLA